MKLGTNTFFDWLNMNVFENLKNLVKWYFCSKFVFRNSKKLTIQRVFIENCDFHKCSEILGHHIATVVIVNCEIFNQNSNSKKLHDTDLRIIYKVFVKFIKLMKLSESSVAILSFPILSQHSYSGNQTSRLVPNFIKIEYIFYLTRRNAKIGHYIYNIFYNMFPLYIECMSEYWSRVSVD